MLFNGNRFCRTASSVQLGLKPYSEMDLD